MDKQNPGVEKHVPTAQEIARLEAEAAAAISRGETPSRGEAPSQGEAPPRPEAAPQPEDAPKPEAPARPDFVPYVDDVPDAPKPRAAVEAKSEDAAQADDEDDEEYIPSKWEVRVNALTPKQWRLTQIVGGAALGLVALGILLIGTEELATYRLIVAALLALLAPRYIERVIRRDLLTARRAMIVALAVGLVVAFLILGARNGFQFTKAPE